MAKFRFEENISLDLIDPNPKNPMIYAEDDIEHLAAKIKEEGFKHPIKLFDKGNGRFEISSGHRRVKAMKMLGAKTIPSIIEDMPQMDYNRTRDLLSGNLEQRKISPLEKAREIEAYKLTLEEEGFKGNTRKKVAEYFNLTESNVYRYECILKLIPELQNYCKKPNFPYSSLQSAASLSEDEQRKIYDKLIELEASEKKISVDEVDRDEIVFTRTRIEQIINNTIKQSERLKKESITFVSEEENLENKNKYFSDDCEPDDTILKTFEKENDNSFNMESYVIEEDDDEAIEINDEMMNLNSNVSAKGMEDCIKTIKAYKNLRFDEVSKKVIKNYIVDLKNLLIQLESMLEE